jgi:hypothetical protein
VKRLRKFEEDHNFENGAGAVTLAPVTQTTQINEGGRIKWNESLAREVL